MMILCLYLVYLIRCKIIAFPFLVLGQELSDQKLLSLSEEITDSGQLRCLAIHGLQVKPKTVESCLTNAKKISEAAYQVIRGWINNEPDRKVAYDKMCRALAHDEVKLRLLIHEVLNKRQ